MKQIINTWGQLEAAVEAGIIPKEKAVALSYAPSETQGCSVANTRVFSPFFKTHPGEAAWYQYGDMSFSGNRSSSMEEAKAWAEERYGITEWKGNRMRDVVPAIVQKHFPILAR
jgi:hypothetical protein